MRVAEFRLLIERAAAGQLRFPQNWKPVARIPDLWELRWSWECVNDACGCCVIVRGYFHEPPRLPGDSVLAKVHCKLIDGSSSEQISARQDRYIDQASERLREGDREAWGVDRKSSRHLCC